MADIAVGAALFLIEKVLSFLLEENSLHKQVHDDVKVIEKQIGIMKAYLKDVEGTDGNEGQKELVTQIRDLAYDMEDTLDEFMFHIPINHHTSSLMTMGHKIKHFFPFRAALRDMSSNIKGIEKTKDDILKNKGLLAGTTISREGSSSTLIVTSHFPEEEILGFDEHSKQIINQLINGGEPRRKTIAVVGPPGSGKSVLSNMVYNDRKVRRKFDCRAWVPVTRACQIEELLLNLLNQLVRKKMDVGTAQAGVHTLEDLRHYLEKKRYIIVLDDIWRRQDWENIVGALPQGKAGSAIIVTTRSKVDVASSNVHIHEVNGLSRNIAWKLFCKKAFYASNEECPAELLDLSEKIVVRCEGMPLAIVAVGSLLSKKQQLPTEWKKLHDSLGSEIGSNSDLSVITNTLLSSYNDMPSHLKSCFLYMGIFPEDYSINRGRLIRSWVAEGFVKAIECKTLEEVAEDYLNELIGKYMILASKIDFDGRAKSCRVQNIMRGFIIMKSKENKFVAVTSSEIKGCRRLSIPDASTIEKSQNLDLSLARRTFFMSGRSIGSLSSSILGDFKLLKVLDMQDTALENFPEQIVELRLLRYLSLRKTYIKSVPKSIKKLAHLETLDLKHNRVTRLPKEIFELYKLRHLLVFHYYDDVKSVDFDNARGVEVFAGIGNLTAIQKLSLIKVSHHQGLSAKILKREGSIIEELGKLDKLRNLGIVDLKREDGKKLCSSIQKMESLSSLDVRSTTKEEYLDLDALNGSPPTLLQRLYLKGLLSTCPKWIGSLNSLVRISLRWSRLDKSPLLTIQDLPNLIELQMVDAFIGDELIFEAAKFKKLKILLVEQIESLHRMKVEEGALTELKKLTISKCRNLKMLPLGISFVRQLEDLSSYEMPEEFTEEVQRHRKVRQVATTSYSSTLLLY